jgi:hypothetical protein
MNYITGWDGNCRAWLNWTAPSTSLRAGSAAVHTWAFLRGRLCAPNSLIRICGQGGDLLPMCGMGVQINGSGRLSAAIAILAVKI